MSQLVRSARMVSMQICGVDLDMAASRKHGLDNEIECKRLKI